MAVPAAELGSSRNERVEHDFNRHQLARLAWKEGEPAIEDPSTDPRVTRALEFWGHDAPSIVVREAEKANRG